MKRLRDGAQPGDGAVNEPVDGRGDNVRAISIPGVQLLLVVVVCFAWIAVLFLPVTAQVQIGVQAAMMLVLGAIFGVQIVRVRNQASSSVVSNDEP